MIIFFQFFNFSILEFCNSRDNSLVHHRTLNLRQQVDMRHNIRSQHQNRIVVHTRVHLWSMQTCHDLSDIEHRARGAFLVIVAQGLHLHAEHCVNNLLYRRYIGIKYIFIYRLYLYLLVGCYAKIRILIKNEAILLLEKMMETLHATCWPSKTSLRVSQVWHYVTIFPATFLSSRSAQITWWRWPIVHSS